MNEFAHSYVPKSIKRVREETRYGLSVKFVFVSILLAFISLLIVYKTYTHLLRLEVASGVLVVLWSILIFNFRSPKLWKHSTDILLYILAFTTQNTTYKKYIDSENKLFDLVWIKQFHSNGMIEFFTDKYAVLLKVDPDKVNDEEVEGHLEKIKQLVDSIDNEKSLVFYVSSQTVMGDKKIGASILQVLKDPNTKSPEVRNHLFELYKELHQEATPEILWNFYILVDLGAHLDIKDAGISLQRYYPGIENRLVRTGMHVKVVTDRYELMKAYHECILQEGY